MKTVKVTTDNVVSVIDIPFVLGAIEKEVGGYEHVHTQKLRSYFGGPVVMIVDDDGIRKNKPINKLGCVFYGTAIHENPIVGDLIFATIKGEDVIGLQDAEEVKRRLLKDFKFLYEEKM